MHTMTRWLAGAATLLLLGSSGTRAAEPQALADFTKLQQQAGAGKYVEAEKTATALLRQLGEGSGDPLVGRVLAARARTRLMQGHLADAVVDYLATIGHAENGQGRAAGYLDLAAAMTRLQLGDHACAAIRRAIDQAESELTPLGRVALAQSKDLGCPAFADRDFARLFALPFRLAASTDGTALAPLYGGAVFIRLPTGWTLDATSLGSPDGVDAVSKDADAVCTIRRSDGATPIKAYVDAVAKEDPVRGRRADGVLWDVDAREGRMGPQRSVEVDFAVASAGGPLPGRLELASRHDRTYAVLCMAVKPGGATEARRTSRLIADSMRWRP